MGRCQRRIQRIWQIKPLTTTRAVREEFYKQLPRTTLEPSSHPSLGLTVFFLSFYTREEFNNVLPLEDLEGDILWPRWVARIEV